MEFADLLPPLVVKPKTQSGGFVSWVAGCRDRHAQLGGHDPLSVAS